MKTVKVGISLPTDLLEAIDQECRRKGVSRSEFFRNAVDEAFRVKQEQGAVSQYLRGYRSNPESAREAEEALRIAIAALAQEPWD